MGSDKQREKDMESWCPFRDGPLYIYKVVQATIFRMWVHKRGQADFDCIHSHARN